MEAEAGLGTGGFWVAVAASALRRVEVVRRREVVRDGVVRRVMVLRCVRWARQRLWKPSRANDDLMLEMWLCWSTG